MRTYLAGKTNKLKEKHVESSQQLVNRVPTSLFIHQFRICGFCKKVSQTVAQHSDVQIEGQLLLYNFIVYLQRNDVLSKE